MDDVFKSSSCLCCVFFSLTKMWNQFGNIIFFFFFFYFPSACSGSCNLWFFFPPHTSTLAIHIKLIFRWIFIGNFFFDLIFFPFTELFSFWLEKTTEKKTKFLFAFQTQNITIRFSFFNCINFFHFPNTRYQFAFDSHTLK